METLYNLAYNSVRLTDIADVQRPEANKTYPAGTIYIQISACRRAGLEQFFMTKQPQKIENKYAVVIPKIDIVPEYFLEVLNFNADEFMFKYVGTNINISINSFKWFRLAYHTDKQVQRLVMNVLDPIKNAIVTEENAIAASEKLKQFGLATMFC